jgi:hypothetical protein
VCTRAQPLLAFLKEHNFQFYDRSARISSVSIDNPDLVAMFPVLNELHAAVETFRKYMHLERLNAVNTRYHRASDYDYSISWCPNGPADKWHTDTNFMGDLDDTRRVLIIALSAPVSHTVVNFNAHICNEDKSNGYEAVCDGAVGSATYFDWNMCHRAPTNQDYRTALVANGLSVNMSHDHHFGEHPRFVLQCRLSHPAAAPTDRQLEVARAEAFGTLQS